MSLLCTQPLHEPLAALPHQLIVTLAGLSKAMMGSLVALLAPICFGSVHVLRMYACCMAGTET